MRGERDGGDEEAAPRTPGEGDGTGGHQHQVSPPSLRSLSAPTTLSDDKKEAIFFFFIERGFLSRFLNAATRVRKRRCFS